MHTYRIFFLIHSFNVKINKKSFQDGMVAFNFAFEEEAETFLHVAKTTVANRNRRREGKEKIK